MSTSTTAKLAVQRKLTPPQVAERLGVNPGKVTAFIRAGELKAIDISFRPGVGRPRYRIDVEDLLDFENRRVAGPAVKAKRRSRAKSSDVIEFYK